MHLPGVRPAVLLVVTLAWVISAHAAHAQKLNRRDLEKLVAEADALAAEGRLADARQRLATVHQQDPANAPVALKLARICEALPDWDCASAAYQAAAANSKGPEKADAHAGLAAVHALDPKLMAAHLGLGRVLREHRKDPAAAPSE